MAFSIKSFGVFATIVGITFIAGFVIGYAKGKTVIVHREDFSNVM